MRQWLASASGLDLTVELLFVSTERGSAIIIIIKKKATLLHEMFVSPTPQGPSDCVMCSSTREVVGLSLTI